jgi:surfeit locus 1 family protein
VLRLPRRPGFFAPEHAAEAPVWLWYDLAGLERRLGLDLAPAVLETEIPERVELADNHLQYALTWFALAAALAAIYVLSQSRRPPA